MKSLFFSLFASFLFLLSCSNDPQNGSTDMQRERPHEPWVFRSVLDWNPRIITLALSDEVWAAYSTQKCALYKVWGGTVHFDGPVYTHRHGPQPISIGNAYYVNEYDHPWYLKSATADSIGLKANYKGHKFVEGHAILLYELITEDGLTKIEVEEYVEAGRTEAAMPVFQRKYTINNVPEDRELHLKTNIHSIILEQNIATNGTWTTESKEEVAMGDNKTALSIRGNLQLVKNGTTEFDITFLQTPLVDNPNTLEKESGEEEKGLPEGARLIAQSDCKTCHNKNLKTIGPAYVAIAEKYPFNQQNTAMLANKIKQGGTGVWGNQVMTPHADLSQADAELMVEYILGLGSAEKAVEESGDAFTADIGEPVDGKDLVFIPGLMTSIYSIKKGVKQMPASTGKPLYAGILGNLDNIADVHWKGLIDDFKLVSKGYLYVEKPGRYNLELWSDDGSILYINDRVVVNNDGLHSVSRVGTDVDLKAGYYPIRVEFFQGTGGKFLSFNWKKPGDEFHEVIPTYNLSHTKIQQGNLDGYTMPMAIVTKIPGDRQPLNAVHPAFDLAQARPADFTPKVGGLDFLSDGRMVISTWDPTGGVYILEGVEGDNPEAIKVKKIAAGLAEPLGVAVVDDRIFVMQKQEITELIDYDGDDVADEYRTLADDWEVTANFHEFGFGLAHKDGYLYASLASAILAGGASPQGQPKDRGRTIKVDIHTGKIEFITSGLRTPNGIGVGYNGEIFVADNQGDWLPASKILHVTEGAFFGARAVDPEGSKDLVDKNPLVWLPQDEIGNSPSTPLALNVGPYKNQMIHSEVTHGGVKRVFVEEVNGELQGAVFRFIQGLEAGINRMNWGPDGSLYVGGIGNPGNWGEAGKLWYGLQRLSYNGKSAFEMLAVRAKTNGLEVEFTEPLKEGDGWYPSSYEVVQWYYKPTAAYGGPKMDERTLAVKSASVSEDRKKVFLEIDGIKPGHVVYLRLVQPFISANNRSLWSTEAWYTMNNIPINNNGTVKKAPPAALVNTLTEDEKKQGWQLLFDGKSISHFRNFKKESLGKSWVINDDAIHLNAVLEEGQWQAKDGGDIITLEEYEDFEFKVDWKITNCGNSGIMFNVAEQDGLDYVWQSGPEMQILDNVCHPDTRFPTHRAGDLYDMIECRYVTVKPAGEWNTAVIHSKDGQVQFYLNGHMVVEFSMVDDSWKDRIAKSKFKDMPYFGTFSKGHISLQDHGDKVWFRNIKIRRI